MRSAWGTPCFAVVALLEISPEDVAQMSKDAAIASQRVPCQFVHASACIVARTLEFQAYAPTQNRVSSFLASEANQHACATCDGKDYAAPCPLDWTALEDGRCVGCDSDVCHLDAHLAIQCQGARRPPHTPVRVTSPRHS